MSRIDDGTLTADDLRQLQERGIPVEEARRQVELLASPEHFVEVVRPCVVGDGIVRIEEAEIAELHALHAEAARAGRLIKFVPSSGAASRMFKSLLYFQQGPGVGTSWRTVVGRAKDGDAAAGELVTFLEQLHRFAFYDDLKACLRARGQDVDALAADGCYAPILDGLLAADGMDYDAHPKGLLKFHRYEREGRTALEEHLVQANEYVRDRNGVCRLHFTIMPRFRAKHEATVRRAQERRIAGDARFETGYSVQKPSTDTLSLDRKGRLVRDEAGRLKFRPGGHGALIENLNDLEADLVLIRNIDNVRPEGAASRGSRWKRALTGYLLKVQRDVFRFLDGLCDRDPSADLVAQARAFARDRFGFDPARAGGATTAHGAEDERASLIAHFHRPVRVCGVVPNTGEPGGGPFWVRGADGYASPQIVEASQVDPHDGRQQELLRSSTHFNPVDLVCAVRDHRGRPFDLTQYVDPEAVIVSSKSDAGCELWALERPGLWNGAMAYWNTVFVEVPIETFTPVKTVIDLLRDEHQPD